MQGYLNGTCSNAVSVLLHQSTAVNAAHSQLLGSPLLWRAAYIGNVVLGWVGEGVHVHSITQILDTIGRDLQLLCTAK